MAKTRKKKYNAKLTQKERHRVADAIYRMRVEGYIFPDGFDYTQIYPANNYKDIKKQAANAKGVTYSGRRKAAHGFIKEKPGNASGAVAYEYQEAHKEYKKSINKTKRKLKKAGLYLSEKDLQTMEKTLTPDEFKKKAAGKFTDSDFPKYDIFSVGPSYFDVSKADLTDPAYQAKVDKDYTENLKLESKRIKRLAKNPIEKPTQRMKQAKINLLSSLDKHFDNAEVRNLIEAKVKDMNYFALNKWQEEHKGEFDFSDFFGYNFKLYQSIGAIMQALDMDMDMKLSDGRTLQEYADDAMYNGGIL